MVSGAMFCSIGMWLYSKNIMSAAAGFFVGGIVGFPAGIVIGYLRRKESIEKGDLTEFPELAAVTTHEVVNIPLLVTALKNESKSVRKAALRALVEIGPQAAPAVPALIHQLLLGAPPDLIPKDGCEICGKKLTIWTRHVGTQRCLSCGNRVGTPSLTTYELAAEALGHIGPNAKQAVPALLRVRKSRDPGLSKACDRALKRIRKEPGL
jgi:hypothetical protein